MHVEKTILRFRIYLRLKFQIAEKTEISFEKPPPLKVVINLLLLFAFI